MGELEPKTPADDGGGPDPLRIRISDADREAVAQQLQTAAGEGRIEFDELDERLGLVYAAKTAGDLVPLVADLPAVEQSRAPAPLSGNAIATDRGGKKFSGALMSGQDRAGRWTVAPTHTALAVMGGVDLDLRQATFTSAETVINASAIMGGIDIVVGPNVRLEVSGIPIMGGYGHNEDPDLPPPPADAPIVRVRGIALMGGVDVHRKAMDPPQVERSNRKAIEE